LLFNGMFKIPMQFVILLIGVLVYVFYLFTPPPIFFNQPAWERVARSEHAADLEALESRYTAAFAEQRNAASTFVAAIDRGDASSERHALRAAVARTDALRDEAKALVSSALPDAETKDADYVFLTFVLDFVPAGLVGLLIAVILCAAMSSTASELSALGATSTVDLYKRVFDAPAAARRDLLVSKAFTVLWGAVAISFAAFASLFENLIEAVNILGSIFYGTILGIFVVAFFLPRVSATPVLIAALVAQAAIVALFFASDLGFLWYNVIGCAIVAGLSLLLESLRSPRSATG
jgi:uncharacterized sodium:solute symporter family permease YidK